MFLTRIQIEKTEAASVKLWDAYAWHQALWHAFNADDHNGKRFLFRIDDFRTYFQTLLLSEQGITDKPWGGKGVWDTKKIDEAFYNYNIFRFQIKTNPTMKRTFANGKKRIGIYKQTELHEWMARKALISGFSIAENTLRIGSPMDEVFRKEHKTGKLVSVDFSGVLKVENNEKFISAFKNGIGSAKAFGFGLLMLKPVQ